MGERYYPDPNIESRDLRRVVIGLILFFSLLVTVAVLIFINAQSIAQALPFAAEKRFIRPYEQAIGYFIRDREPPPKHAEIRDYLTQLAGRLSTEMELPQSYTLSVHYIDSDMINAFAMLGGHVFVTRGLLDALDSENSLSLVLAHEIAHVKQRDPLAAMGRGMAIQLIINFVTGQSGNGSTIAASGGELGLLHFSRTQESEADVIGLTALYRHYGHVEGAGGLFELLLEGESAANHNKNLEHDDALDDVEDTLQGWLSTHPELAERLGDMKSLAEQKKWPTQGVITPLPAWLKDAVKPKLAPDPFEGL